jgi:hypothetical protein
MHSTIDRDRSPRRRVQWKRHIVVVTATVLAWSGISQGEEVTRIDGYHVVPLIGSPELSEELSYVSFSGDFGFKKTVHSWDPVTETIDRHLANETPLLSRFDLNIVNMEEMLHGHLGSPLDQRQDDAAVRLLAEAGFEVAAIANNHAWDYGEEGLALTTRRLAERSIEVVGSRDFPSFRWMPSGQDIAIFSATHYTDAEDESGRILTLSDTDLQSIMTEIEDAAFKIAFIHLGSISAFPSPHELEQVRRVIEAGADLVVCTGNHLVKGFAFIDETPVHLGIGNHMMSWKGENTEPIGSHLVAGFKDNRLVQLLMIPFNADISGGRVGPLDEADFQTFAQVFRDRSEFDESNYFKDSISRDLLFHELQFLSPSRVLRYRPRHIIYGLGVLRAHYPIAFWTAVIGGTVGGLIATTLALRWFQRRRRSPHHS